MQFLQLIKHRRRQPRDLFGVLAIKMIMFTKSQRLNMKRAVVVEQP